MTVPTGEQAFDLDRLSAEQMSLLDLIFHPLREEIGEGWPIWAWVENRFEEGHPRRSASRVLASLPVIRPTFPGMRPYGLVWRANPMGPDPLPNENVGLTIVGIAYLAVKYPSLRDLADGLVEILRDVALMDKALAPTPTKTSVHDQPLSFFTQELTNAMARRRIALSLQEIAVLLRYEYANPLVLNPNNGSWLIQLDGLRLRQWREINNVDDYLRLIADLDAEFHAEDESAPAHLLPPEIFESGSTGDSRWRILDSDLRTVVSRFRQSEGTDWPDLGLRCVQILIDVSRVVRDDLDPPAHPPKDEDAKQWLGLYVRAKGGRAELVPVIQNAWVLAQRVKHRGRATRADVFAAVQATILVARTVQQLHTQMAVMVSDGEE